MAIVVLPRIEQENPFGELAQVISEQALPYLIKLYANKDKIAKLSDTELTDFVEVLQRYAPELVSDGKINWEKVNEWAQSDDQTKLQVASFLFDAKRMREDFANAPLIAKLQIIDVAGSINPQELNKIFVASKMQQKLAEAIEKSNLPDEYKLLFLANVEKFVEKPHLIPILEKVLGGTTQAGNTVKAQDSGGGTGSWQFSLDGSKPFGIRLEEPVLNMNLPTRPNINTQSVQVSKGRKTPPQKQPEQNKSASKPEKSEKEKATPPVQKTTSTSEEITLPPEVPFSGDINRLFTNEQLLTAGAGALATLLALAGTRNPNLSIQAPLILASLKEAGKKAGNKAVSVVKKVPEKVKEASTKLAQSGVVRKVEPPLPKTDKIVRVINPPQPPRVSDLLQKIREAQKPSTTNKPKRSKGRKQKK